jgi:hypothetical protein
MPYRGRTPGQRSLNRPIIRSSTDAAIWPHLTILAVRVMSEYPHLWYGQFVLVAHERTLGQQAIWRVHAFSRG